eukprot:3855054-Pyramimonas_sp.AAC.1
MAAACALKVLMGSMSDDLGIVAFVDDAGALGALLRGCSRRADWGDLIGELRLSVAQRGHVLHMWHAPSFKSGRCTHSPTS